MLVCYADGFHLSNTFKVRVRVWLIAPSQSNSWALTSFVDDVGQALDLDDSGVLTNDEIDNITPFLSAPVPPPPSSHSTTPESSIHLVLRPYIVVALYCSSTSY